MGGKQLGFSDYEQATAKMRTKQKIFLAETDKVVPWQALFELINPYYPMTSMKGGRPPCPQGTMLRTHLMQKWTPLNDPAMEEALIEVPTLRRFNMVEASARRLTRDRHVPICAILLIGDFGWSWCCHCYG